jgi:hypothetical protein
MGSFAALNTLRTAVAADRPTGQMVAKIRLVDRRLSDLEAAGRGGAAATET